jgi:hypothetical protein
MFPAIAYPKLVSRIKITYKNRFYTFHLLCYSTIELKLNDIDFTVWNRPGNPSLWVMH